MEIKLLLAFEWGFVGIQICFSLTFFKNKLFKFPTYSNNIEEDGFSHERFSCSEF